MPNSKRITAWSFSRYNLYKQCPLKLKLSALDKIREPPNKAMERGNTIHKLAEDYVKGKIPKLPKELVLFEDEFKYLKKRYKKRTLVMVVEDSWAFTKDWVRTTWDNWANCWVRIKLDVAWESDIVDNVLIVRDWKTGKFRPDQQDMYIEQLELYALAGLLIHPHVEKVVPSLGYLDLGRVYPDEDEDEEEISFTRDDIPMLLKLWAKRVKPMLNDTKFAPRPNQWCGYCHYRKSNKANGGGQCKY